jgi:hypothetical protein
MFPTGIPWYEFVTVYVGSALTGQLWMWTYDTTENAVAGCVAWGTCGVLCAIGMAKPHYRFEAFVLASLLLLLSLFQRPYDSVLGTTGSAFFGWSLGAAGLVNKIEPPKLNENDFKETKIGSFIGTGFFVLIVSLPFLSLTFRY